MEKDKLDLIKKIITLVDTKEGLKKDWEVYIVST